MKMGDSVTRDHTGSGATWHGPGNFICFLMKSLWPVTWCPPLPTVTWRFGFYPSSLMSLSCSFVTQSSHYISHHWHCQCRGQYKLKCGYLGDVIFVWHNAHPWWWFIVDGHDISAQTSLSLHGDPQNLTQEFFSINGTNLHWRTVLSLTLTVTETHTDNNKTGTILNGRLFLCHHTN